MTVWNSRNHYELMRVIETTVLTVYDLCISIDLLRKCAMCQQANTPCPLMYCHQYSCLMDNGLAM